MELVKNRPQSTPDLFDQASAWIANLSSDEIAESDIQEFSLWLSQSDAHKSAYDEILDLWQDLGVVKHLPITIPSYNNTNKTTRFFKNKFNWSIVTTLAASIVFAIVMYPIWFTTPAPQFFSTAVGQQQTVHLDEGSAITLNTNTRLEVSLSKNQRSILLHSGEAFFDVAKDPHRPFVVNSCFSEVRAIGTAFNIRCDRKKGIVTVTHGLVQVSDTTATHEKNDSKLVAEGQAINIDDTLGISEPHVIDSDKITSWRRGQFIFKNTPLTEVIDEANRYTTSRILLGSPQLAQLQVTGRFELTDTKTLVAALKHSLSLESVTQKDKSIILNKPTQ